jgi:hypothetical protein
MRGIVFCELFDIECDSGHVYGFSNHLAEALLHGIQLVEYEWKETGIRV